MASSDDAYWASLRDENFVFEDGCWRTCGGFCCANNHPDFAFRLLPMQGTTILYMPREYDYLRRHGRVFETRGAEDAAAPQSLSLDFGGPKPLTVLHTTCRLLGQCTGIIDKPLLCRIYPFLPRLGLDGEIEGLMPSSIYDLTFKEKGWDGPCTVWSGKQDHYLKQWQQRPEALAKLQHPYVLFYLRAVASFSDIFRRKLLSSPTLANLTGRDFWQRWELEYLGGRLLDLDEFRARVYADYTILAQRHGAFL